MATTLPLKKKTELMDLSNELIERILQCNLLADRPIEFAPLRSFARSTGGQFVVGGPKLIEKDDPDVRFYRDDMRPNLGVLGTCSLFHTLGARIYYAQNAFRFSNALGMETLAFWLEFIGPNNTNLLRDITISHPAVSKLIMTPRVRELVKHNLAAFGMRTSRPEDLPDKVKRLGERAEQRLRNVLAVLRGAAELRSLTMVTVIFNAYQCAEEKLLSVLRDIVHFEERYAKLFPQASRGITAIFSDRSTPVQLATEAGIDSMFLLKFSAIQRYRAQLERAGTRVFEQPFEDYDDWRYQYVASKGNP